MKLSEVAASLERGVALAEELGINLTVYSGHYATETFGLSAALAELLSRTLNLPWAFVDHPSGP